MILRGNDKIATKNLIINSNDDQLKKNLRYINMEGPGDPTVRRKINKGFLDCLEEVQLDRPSALVWLKKRICFDVCQTMMGDWSHSGKIRILNNQFCRHFLSLYCTFVTKVKILWTPSLPLNSDIINELRFLYNRLALVIRCDSQVQLCLSNF